MTSEIKLPRTPDGAISLDRICAPQDDRLIWLTDLDGEVHAHPIPDVLRAIHEDGQRVGAERMRERAENCCKEIASATWASGIGGEEERATECADRIRKLEIELWRPNDGTA